jgi:hypothetical protein
VLWFLTRYNFTCMSICTSLIALRFIL